MKPSVAQFVLGTLLLLVQFGTSGCTFFPEAEFRLAQDSRVPRWFDFPACKTGQQCHVQLSTYDPDMHVGTGFRTRIYGPDGSELARVWPVSNGHVDRADLDGTHTGNRLADMYPSYEVLSFSGVHEVFEFKKPEPIFYVVDNPDLIAKVVNALPSQ